MNKQEEAFEKLSKLKVGALFMEMGTGKTKVALDLIASKKNKVEYVLWICPFSLKSEIENERRKWHSELTLDVVGVESIGASDLIYIEVRNKVENHKTFIVVDESLKIKNKDAKRTQRILNLGQLAEYRLILNGTPLSKNVLDLWTQMQFLSPKILNMSYNEFKNLYTEYYVRGRLKGLVKKQHNIEHLISKIEPYIFNCELDIEPKKHHFDYTYYLNDIEMLEYQNIKRNIINEFENQEQIDFYWLCTELQKFYTGAEDRQTVLTEIIKEIDGQAIVFVKFLKNIPDGALKIVGEMTTNERAETIEKFKSGQEKILYITYGCGAFGLNLQFCKNIIFADHTFDYSQRIQAEARIYRIGQADDVNYFSLWCGIGLENMIQGSLEKKTNLLNDVKKEIQKKGVKDWAKDI